MNNKIDIKMVGNEIVVTDGKTEFFRRQKTKQTLSIAHDIYMYYKYKDSGRVVV